MNLLVFFAGKGAAPNGSAIVDKSVLDITKSSLLFTLDIPANIIKHTVLQLIVFTGSIT